MMEYDLNLEGWLENATLFPPSEPSDYSLSFDLLPSGKTNNEAGQVTGFSDLPWFDEKVDLSILEDPKNVQLTETDLKEILSIFNSNLDTSYLSSEIPNSSYLDVLDFDLNDLQSQAASPGSSDDLPFSNLYEDISEANSPAGLPCSPLYEPISEVDSPASFVSDSTVNSAFSSGLSLSPESTSSIAEESCQETAPAVIVTVCNDQDIASREEVEALSIEEVSSSVRKRKFVNKGNEIPKVHVSLKNAFHPYSKATTRRGSNKSDRKKVQNKEAAARYRVKKRIEEKELSDEVAGLEAEQKKLKSTHDDLETEIKYLKKLMREMLQKKGIL